MTREELKALQEKRLELAAQIKAMADKYDGTGKAWSAEDEANWKRLNSDYNAVKTEIDAGVQALEREAETRRRLDEIEADGRERNPLIGRDGGRIDDGPRHPEHFGGAPRGDRLALALQGWMRGAHDPADAGPVTQEHHAAAKACGINLSAPAIRIPLQQDYRQVRNTLSGVNGPAGGYTYGETFVGNLERAMLAFGGMLQVADVIRTGTGEPMRWPTAKDTQNTGRQIGESQAVTGKDPTFAQVVWNAYKFTSDEILVPFELLRDNAVNLATVLPDMLGERLGRIQNTKYTLGDGANTPWGIVTRAALGVTAAAATQIKFDELMALEHSIDPSRRNMSGVGYMFHDNVLLHLRKLKDGEGRYLWQAGANTGAPPTLNGYPYTINQDMANAVSAGQTTVLFGQMTQYKIRQVGAIRLYRLVERHRENDQDAFLAFVEGDGNLLDAGDSPVKKLVQA